MLMNPQRIGNMIQWIGIALTIIGMLASGYNNYKQNPQNIQLTKATETAETQKPRFLYATINVAYDTQTGKHLFLHPNGQWYEMPPRPF